MKIAAKIDSVRSVAARSTAHVHQREVFHSGNVIAPRHEIQFRTRTRPCFCCPGVHCGCAADVSLFLWYVCAVATFRSSRCQISAGQVWAAEITAAVVLVLRLLPFSCTDFAVVFVQFLSWSLKNLILYGSKMAAWWSWSQSSRDHRFELMMLLLGEFLPFLGVVRLGFFPTNTHHCSQVGACKRYSCNRARPFPWSRTQHWLRLAELSWRPPRLLPGLDLDIPWTQHDHGTNYSRRRDRPWAGISASQLLALHAQPSPRHGTPRNKATKLLKRKTTRNTSLRAALPARNVKLPALAISLLPCAFAWRFPFSALHYWNWYKNKNLLLPLFNFSPSTRSSLSFTSSTGT